ncbi:MAG: hypothetical protein DMD89_10180 [Candidatus Rokuibacteriota bacterium]|nr:MAG: hypothetical protein DMD89_10180 [Candidatus Rokubacteria bacterium]
MNFRGPVLAFVLALVLPVAAQAQQETTVPPYIEAVRSFLVGWGHESWDQMQAVGADSVSVSMGDKVFAVAPASRKSDIMIVFPFRGLSTVRAGDEVKSVTVQELGLRVGDKETRGPATITVKEENGRYRVVGISLDDSQ